MAEPIAAQAPLETARATLARRLELIDRATRELEGQIVLPQVEAAWRSQQDGLMQLAQAAALVSIAGSLAEIAEALRPDVRFAEEPDKHQDLAARLRELVGRRWPADRVPLEHLVDLLGEHPAPPGSGEVSGG